MLESILSFYLEMGVLRTLMDRFGIHVSKPCNHLILSVRADMIWPFCWHAISLELYPRRWPWNLWDYANCWRSGQAEFMRYIVSLCLLLMWDYDPPEGVMTNILQHGCKLECYYLVGCSAMKVKFRQKVPVSPISTSILCHWLRYYLDKRVLTGSLTRFQCIGPLPILSWWLVS